MRRFLEGFLFGIVIGAIAAWLYQRYLWPTPETVPARPAPAEVPPDDFVALHGVGEAFAQRLLQAGIRSYADLARLTPEEVAARCQIPAWRIRRDDWVGQAAARMHP
jgi:predicted flap endonuclease-1-like 5' DNA nuclease